MAEEIQIFADEGERFRFNVKRTDAQRKRDRDFLESLLIDNVDATQVELYLLVQENIKKSGDDYEISYQYFCREYNKIKKSLIEDSGIIVMTEINKDLELLNESIKIVWTEIKNRMTSRESVKTVIEDLTVRDYKGLSLEEIHVVNRINDKIKKRSVTVEKIRAGSDVKEMFDSLVSLLKRKSDLIGEDAPKKSMVKMDIETEIKGMSNEVMQEELKGLGLSQTDILILQSTLEQTVKKAK